MKASKRTGSTGGIIGRKACWALALSGFLLVFAAGGASSNTSSKSTLDDQQSVAVTIYNSDLGVVKDVRRLRIPQGVVSLTFEGVASKIDPTSVSIRSLDKPGKLSVLEQNFEFDLISPAKLMEKYLGMEVELVAKTKKGEQTRKARLIGIDKGYVYEINGKIEMNPPGRVVLPELPEGLISKPSLVWLLDNRAGDQTIEASYMTSGMSWRANYVAVLSEDDKKMDFTGWVTINNKSGATYNDAVLKLIAGDVHRVSRMTRGRLMKTEGMMLRAAKTMEEKSFFEYHMYTLGRRTTLKNNQSKQLKMVEAKGAGVDKKFIYAPRGGYFYSPMGGGSMSGKAGVYLELDNSSANNLGIPIPKGVIRVYKKDDDGSLEFLGEDEVDHTPEDEKIRMKIGDAFDVVAEHVQTDFKKMRNSYESSYKVTIRNHKKEKIVVSVIERIYGDWKIRDNTYKFIKEASDKVRFDVPVDAKGESILMYRVIVKQ